MHSAQVFFLTGTDTEVGKTHSACALLAGARAQGRIALGMKPVAAGLDGQGRNDDVERLAAASSFRPDARLINQYALAAPIAPHLAAADEGVEIDFDRIGRALGELRLLADLVIVEGVGGFRVPLTASADSADLAVALGLPVILVVGLRLGCINHALLSAEAIERRGLHLAGWIANTVAPNMTRALDNVATLKQRLAAPLLGTLPHLSNPGGISALFLP
jgi:dethiobiotin synthetase